MIDKIKNEVWNELKTIKYTTRNWGIIDEAIERAILKSKEGKVHTKCKIIFRAGKQNTFLYDIIVLRKYKDTTRGRD